MNTDCISIIYCTMFKRLHWKSKPTCCLWWIPPPPWPPSLPPSRSSVCKRRNSRLNVHSPGTFTMELTDNNRGKTWSVIMTVVVDWSILGNEEKNTTVLLIHRWDSGGHLRRRCLVLSAICCLTSRERNREASASVHGHPNACMPCSDSLAMCCV